MKCADTVLLLSLLANRSIGAADRGRRESRGPGDRPSESMSRRHSDEDDEEEQ